MDNYNYPLGADNAEAPWNKKDQIPEEIDVLVSITLSKNITIKVTDYEVLDEGIDEEGAVYKNIDFGNCDLKEAVLKQICLPQNAYKYTLKGTPVYNQLKDWTIDDFEVIPDKYVEEY